MSDERTVEATAAASKKAGAAVADPPVSTVKKSAKKDVKKNGSGRPAPGTILEQGGDVPDANEGRQPMELGDNLRTLNEGDVVRGIIVHIDREGVLVDVGTKSEGLIPPNELSREPGMNVDDIVKVGDRVDVYVLETDDQEGNLILSKKRADFEKAWDRVIESQGENRTINAMVTDRVKGGLVVDLGIRGFVPAHANSYVGEGVHVIHMATPSFTGDLLVHNNEPCDAGQPFEGGVSLWNVTNPRAPAKLAGSGG